MPFAYKGDYETKQGSDSNTGLAANQSSNDNATVTIPTGTALGAYYVRACADDLNAVSETDETNNCRASTATITVTLPDLVVTAVTNPPALVTAGAGFTVTDTVKNQGTVTRARRRCVTTCRQARQAVGLPWSPVPDPSEV